MPRKFRRDTSIQRRRNQCSKCRSQCTTIYRRTHSRRRSGYTQRYRNGSRHVWNIQGCVCVVPPVLPSQDVCQKAGAPPPQLEQVMQQGGEESSHYTHKSAITKNADDNVPGCIVSTHTNSEDIGSGQFIKIVCFLPHLTSPARPATSARPPHKFLHCFSDTQVRLPTCTARLRGPALPASDFNC